MIVAGHEVVLDEKLLLGVGGFGVCVNATAEGQPVALKVMVGSQPHITASAWHERDVLSADSTCSCAIPPHVGIVKLRSYLELDGADPNGFVGCAWSVMGTHDMGWAERAVFGKIRYMNYNGCKRKFDIARFVAARGPLGVGW